MTRFLIAPGPTTVSASARESARAQMGKVAPEGGAGEQWISREFMGNSKIRLTNVETGTGREGSLYI